MKKSRSDLINKFQEKSSSKVRLSLIERIRSIWKISIKQKPPIIFRKIYPPCSRYQIPITTKTSLGFLTINNNNNLTKQISIQSFHTARESLSEEDTVQLPQVLEIAILLQFSTRIFLFSLNLMSYFFSATTTNNEFSWSIHSTWSYDTIYCSK
jgi:hypothetical protein